MRVTRINGKIITVWELWINGNLTSHILLRVGGNTNTIKLPKRETLREWIRREIIQGAPGLQKLKVTNLNPTYCNKGIKIHVDPLYYEALVYVLRKENPGQYLGMNVKIL